MKRPLRRLFWKKRFHPVSVRKRPMTMEEDPGIAQKVEKQRAWMKEHGIDEPRIQRKPPRAVGSLPSRDANPDWSE